MSADAPEQPQAVVTGIGAVTAQGPDAAALWSGVSGGRVAIRSVRQLSMDGYRTRIAGEVVDDVSAPGRAGYPAGGTDRALDFALVAADEAMAACSAAVASIDPQRWGLVLSTCNAGLLSAEAWYQARERGEQLDPRLLQYSTPQGLAEALAGVHRIRGPVHSLNTACAAGANAIGHAAGLIQRGRADAVLTGGTDALSDVLLSGFNSLESLSPEPAAPYSKYRQGLSLGEGSGMLVLLRSDLAEELGLPAMAEVVSLALSADGYHPTAPHPEGRGAGRAIQQALLLAGIDPDAVDYVNSHGTGTAKNDSAETLAVKYGLGEIAAKGTAISSTKSMIGHLLGAAGAVEAIVTAQAIQHQVAPPTAGLTEAAPDCDLDYVPRVGRPTKIDVALCNNFAFGGANASLVLARPGVVRRREQPTDRPVITGIGVLTPGGDQLDDLVAAVDAGTAFTADEDGVRIGRLPAVEKSELPPKVRRRMDRLGIFSVLAARRALAAAELEIDDATGDRTGAVVGTGIGPMDAMEQFSRPVLQEGAQAASPARFPNTVYNAAAGQVAMQLGTVGPTTTLTDGHAAGAAAVNYCADLVSLDQANAMLAIGVDTLSESVIAGYRALGLLDDARNGDRGAIGLSEASVAILMERRSRAAGRGVPVLAEILGYAACSDAVGVGRWSADGDGIERAVRGALTDAGLGPSEIASVWSSICGLRAADVAERAALDRVFGAEGPAIETPKLIFGDTIGAAAPLALALAIGSWRSPGRRPPGPTLITGSSLGGSFIATIIAPAGDHR